MSMSHWVDTLIMTASFICHKVKRPFTSCVSCIEKPLQWEHNIIDKSNIVNCTTTTTTTTPNNCHIRSSSILIEKENSLNQLFQHPFHFLLVAHHQFTCRVCHPHHQMSSQSTTLWTRSPFTGSVKFAPWQEIRGSRVNETNLTRYKQDKLVTTTEMNQFLGPLFKSWMRNLRINQFYWL